MKDRGRETRSDREGGSANPAGRRSRTGRVRLNLNGLRAAVRGLSAAFGDRRLRCFVWGWLVIAGGVWWVVGRVLGTGEVNDQHITSNERKSLRQEYSKMTLKTRTSL